MPVFLLNSTFAVLDSAKMGNAFEKASAYGCPYVSLFEGRAEKNLARVAPYLFDLRGEQSAGFANWLFNAGWGNSWTIYIKTEISMADLKKHLRSLLMIKTESDEELYFRFYDPRVLRSVVRAMNSDQLRCLFGPVTQFIVEDQDSRYYLQLSVGHGRLIENRKVASN